MRISASFACLARVGVFFDFFGTQIAVFLNRRTSRFHRSECLTQPNARIVHCRRHPIDNCLSCYFTSFAEQIGFANRLDTLARYYIDYDRLMRHWKTVLPIEIFELQYEDLVTDTEDRIRALLAYCGLDWEDACLAFDKTERGIRTPSRWQVRQPIYRKSVARWRNYERQLEPLIRTLQPVLDPPPRHER